MKNPFKRSTDSASIEQELKRLGDRKVEAERRRSEVLAAVEDAREARRNLLDGDQAAIDQASVKLKALQIEAADLAELLDDLEAAIEAASERFRHARDQEARASTTEKLEAVATKVEGQAGQLEAAAKALAKVARLMIDSIPEELGIAPGHAANRPEGRDDPRGMLNRVEMVGAIVADALAAEMPQIFDAGSDYLGRTRALHCITEPNAPMPCYSAREVKGPLAAKEIVAVLIVDRLRDRAAKIKAGELEPVLNDIRPVSVKPPSVNSVELVATEAVCLFIPNDFEMIEAGSYRKILTEGQFHSFREDHAAKLLKVGRFLKRSSPEGQKFVADLLAKNSTLKRSLHRHGPPEHVDLGDPLGLVEAEQEALAETFG